MADILIKGMEIPKACYWRESKDGYVHTCFLAHGFCRNNSSIMEYGVKPDSCPLIEVPPHGDLIDRNKLRDSINEKENTPVMFSIEGVDVNDVMECIIDAPIVLEASNG